ncbi:MAG TPA: GNAT family N-acetyltransferase [Casimicrobiaceae bacterium]|nr:GNAT family N-acetyltransferase [Casimicrobiaceae bacterium]
MSGATITSSIDADREGVGLRAARHLERVFRTLTAGRGGELEDEYFRWVTREPHPLGNVVIQSSPSDGASVRAAIEPLLSDNLPSAVLFPAGASTAATESLIGAGFADAGGLPAMAVDIEHLPPTELPSGYAFTRVGADRRGHDWAEALATGYGLPVGLARRLSPVEVGADMADDARAQFFAIVREDRIVGTSMLFLDDGLAGVYSVTTLAEERGKGIGGHATAEALRVAQALGYRVGVLQSSQLGHPVYLGLGFTDVSKVPMFMRMRAA